MKYSSKVNFNPQTSFLVLRAITPQQFPQLPELVLNSHQRKALMVFAFSAGGKFIFAVYIRHVLILLLALLKVAFRNGKLGFQYVRIRRLHWQCLETHDLHI